MTDEAPTDEPALDDLQGEADHEPRVNDRSEPQEPGNITPDEPTNIALCPNCNTPIDGPFCATCGQSQKNLNKQVWTLAGEVLDDVFRLDSRVSRTLFAMFFRPGFLTTEYFEGRRARYTPPIRLYIVISFLFFFVTPLMSNLELSSDDPAAVVIEYDEDDFQEVEVADELADISFGWLTEEESLALKERIEDQVNKTTKRIEEDPGGVWTEVMDLMSAVMFFMLPIFAIFLKLFYIGSGVYYAEHLLLALHNHCFLFFATLVSGLLELLETTAIGVVSDPLASLISLWIPVYMYLSLKTTFNQSHLTTAFKFFFLLTVYGILAALGLGVAFGIEVLTQ